MVGHEIIINNNINDELKLNYSLVLIKGSVITKECSKAPQELTIINANIKETYKIIDSNFKCLIELNVGENIITLKYCCCSKIIKIIYFVRENNYIVCPLYIINKGHDGLFQAPENIKNTPSAACQRINTVCKLLQTIIAEKLYECQLDRKTFLLKDCTIFESSLCVDEANNMTQKELWASLAREIMDSPIGNNEHKYLGFLSCTKYNGDKFDENMTTHDDYLKITDVHVALGGGGLGLFGTPCLYTWPQYVSDIINCFEDDTIIDKKKFMDDSAYRGTIGSCFSTTLGSVLHELCHTFDLGHTEVGIMGRGFDNIQNIFLVNENKATISLNKDIVICTNKCEKVSIKIKPPDDTKCFTRNPGFSSELLNKIVCVDDTCFTKSCACILAHHKWFNNYATPSKLYVLSFDNTIKLIKSTLGIRVIEIRSFEDEMVVFNWNFIGKILKYNFKLEEDCINGYGGQLTVFAIDNGGNIIKEHFQA